MTGFAGYDAWKCSPPDDSHGDPPDPHDDCEREIEQLHRHIDELETEMAASAPAPMTYAELYAAIGAHLPPSWSYGIEVRAWAWRAMDGATAAPEPQWSIHWFEPIDAEKRRNFHVSGKTARQAFEHLQARVPAHDPTGIGPQVGDGSVK